MYSTLSPTLLAVGGPFHGQHLEIRRGEERIALVVGNLAWTYCRVPGDGLVFAGVEPAPLRVPRV